ncbi:DUF3618 domain-containing protein [Streptomyces sp. NPDC006193]|uniref:DUF3618 domain-containing protein n=1 Tax=Streptomyces sp. NPDC006193 TaxID=3155717 RepID=UPI0033A421DF
MTHKDAHGAGAKGPDELRRQIERTRGELGDTVAQLVERADVKGRARARAADLKDKAGAMTVQLRVSAAQAGHGVQDRAVQAGHSAQERMARAGHLAQERAVRAGRGLEHDTRVPRPVRAAAGAARRHPGPALTVGVAVAAVLTAAVMWRRGDAGGERLTAAVMVRRGGRRHR